VVGKKSGVKPPHSEGTGLKTRHYTLLRIVACANMRASAVGGWLCRFVL
jgi:hypothetical protein